MNAITVHFRSGFSQALTQKEYDMLMTTGMLWEIFPDAPSRWPLSEPYGGVSLCDTCGQVHRNGPCPNEGSPCINPFIAAARRIVPDRDESYRCLQKAFAKMQNGYCRQLTLQQNAKSEWPEVAAWCITNLRARVAELETSVATEKAARWAVEQTIRVLEQRNAELAAALRKSGKFARDVEQLSAECQDIDEEICVAVAGECEDALARAESAKLCPHCCGQGWKGDEPAGPVADLQVLRPVVPTPDRALRRPNPRRESRGRSQTSL